MHQPIREHLEAYLSATKDAAGAEYNVGDHLAHCEECRKMVDQMRAQSALFASLRPAGEMDPAPGFYARVMDQIEHEREQSVWAAFLEPVFFKRLAYGSAAFLLLLAAVILTGERQAVSAPDIAAYDRDSIEAILAGDSVSSSFGDDIERDRNVVLVNLATFEY